MVSVVFTALLVFIVSMTSIETHAADPALQNISHLLKQGQLKDALARTDQYLAFKPKDAQGRFLRGVIFSEMNRTSEAIDIFIKLTKDYPTLPEPYNNLAVLYAYQRQYEKAKDALEMAIHTHPSYATAYENLGDVYARMASQSYDKALQLDSSNLATQNKLALVREIVVNPQAKSEYTAPIPIAPATIPTPTPTHKPTPTPAPTAVSSLENKKSIYIKPEAALKLLPRPGSPPTQAAIQAAPKAVSSTDNDQTKPAKELIHNWMAAWSRKDAQSYLKYYAKDFKTPHGESHAAWEAERIRRINKHGKIQVNVENVKITLEGADRAVVKFRQHYTSASLKVSSNKVLILVKRNEKWLIYQERT